MIELPEAVMIADRFEQFPAGFRRALHAGLIGKPCGKCGTPIEKTSYLGGACYFCPQYQV
ncbi:MAG: hypothetical protein HRF45_04510 [Fimbriimonadia bacterium]|jgi:formamidopyrimidine-DNA glycosylase